MKLSNKFIVIIGILTMMTMPCKAQKWEHLADTPQMGWSTWNKFQGNISEDIIKGIADVMVETGLRDAGYTYINIDDCWHGKRDADGFIQADPIKFPNGIKAVADYVHSKGLKLGIYSDAGSATCAGRPGSLGHEYQDAIQYARWGVDYLKYDWCNTTNINAKGAYPLIRDALHAAGRPILFSICEWGSNNPWKWARDVGHSWRTTTDIHGMFDSIVNYNGWKPYCVMQCIHKNDTLRRYAGKGHWNDPDMLEVGNGMTVNEDRPHFTMWCMMASPLILGNDIRSMSQATKDIVLNKEVIALDQDTLGVQGLCQSRLGRIEFWFKPLAGGDWAFCILNPTKENFTYNLNWQYFNFTDDEVSKLSTGFDKHVYMIRNLWTHKNEGKTSLRNKVDRKITIPAHDVVAYRLVF